MCIRDRLLALRFIAGLGLGGEQPVSYTYVCEMMPSKYRGRIVGVVEAMWGFGAMLAGAVSLLIVPNYGWKFAFFAGAAPAILVWFFRFGIPESPRWFLIRKRPAQAVAQLEEIENAVRAECGGALPEIPKFSATADMRRGQGRSGLFASPYRKRTIMLGIVWFFAMFGFWGINSWVPTLLKQAGYSLFSSIGVYFLMNTMGVPGSLIGAFLSDKIGRKAPLVTYWLAAAAMAVAYGWAMSERADVAVMVALGILAVMLMLGGFAILYAFTPENFPTEIRGAGAGFSNALGRVGAMTSPALVGVLYPRLGLFPTIATIAGAFVIAALCIAILAEETRGKSLEAIAEASHK